MSRGTLACLLSDSNFKVRPFSVCSSDTLLACALASVGQFLRLWFFKDNPHQKKKTTSYYYLGEANTGTLLYKLWQKLHDTPERAAQPDSHTQQPNAKPLAQ